MNFYKHHIGDYAQATAHLTFIEDAAYSRLIRKYYAEERPLPADLKQVQRLVGARSREEREAVETVLAEFFTLDEDGWHQARCDAEIAAATESQGEHEIKKANERERQRRHRERRKQLFDMLRGHGEVPSYDTPTDELVALLSRVTQRDASRDVTPPVTRDATANQTPDSRHQTPELEPNPLPPAAAGEGNEQSTDALFGVPEVKGAAKRKTAPAASLATLPPWLPVESWERWEAFRKRKSAKAWTEDARSLSLRTLTKLREAGHDPTAVIDQSIERGYAGLFELKGAQRKPANQHGNFESQDYHAGVRADGSF